MKKILAVEDDAFLLKALIDKLTLDNFVVLAATNGEEGLKIALSEHPDIILLDILMPVMDGITMFNKLRQDAWGKNVPVIILTNVTPESNAEIKSVLDKQPAYYLIKSSTKLEEVVSKIRELLGGLS